MMSTGTFCDGCGSAAVTVKKAPGTHYDYCEKCAKIVDQYQKKCDELHNKIAAEWQDGLNGITREFGEKYPNLRLPDG